MRKILYFMIALTVLSFASCKDTEGSIGDPIISHGQDRDTDIITGDDYVYHLPVIFHVFYSNTTQYIEYTRLKEILSNVNELYQGDVYNYQMERTCISCSNWLRRMRAARDSVHRVWNISRFQNRSSTARVS